MIASDEFLDCRSLQKKSPNGRKRGRLDIRHGHPHLSGDMGFMTGPHLFQVASGDMGNVFIISLVYMFLYVFIWFYMFLNAPIVK